MKPTYGRVSRYGVIAFASSLDHPGPFGRTVEDTAALLEVMSGPDPLDATSIPQPVGAYREAARVGRKGKNALKGVRLGVPAEYFQPGMDPEVEAAVRAALDELGRAGATIVDVSLPHTRYAIATYYLICTAEASSNLARYDGVRYGHRAGEAKSLEELYTRTRGEGFGAEPKRRIMLGAYVLRAGYYEAYYGKALRARRKLADDFTRGVQQVRRDRHAHVARAGVQVRRAHGRPAADVPGRRAHGGAEPGGASRRCPSRAASPSPACRSACRPSVPPLGEEICFRVGGVYEARTEWHKRLPPEAA